MLPENPEELIKALKERNPALDVQYFRMPVNK